MELRVQLEKWAAQAESADMESAADMDVAVRLLNHGIEALDQLEASKQRELELLAVIENLKDVLSDLRDVQNGSPLPKYDADWEDAMRRTDEALAGIEPSQALREHEAKALEEAADYLDNHCCATGHITSDSTLNELRRMAEERRKPQGCSL
ncbi:MAG TPA: hypothetical protein VIY48_21360 [Candidatus Paceibacterota bacterium]